MKSTYTAGKTILASSVFLGMAFGTAHAEICYKLNPFIDVIRVAQTNFVDEAPNGSHRLVVGNWQGGFSKAVVGSLDVNVPGGGAAWPSRHPTRRRLPWPLGRHSQWSPRQPMESQLRRRSSRYFQQLRHSS
jgi:hypothetical protein